MPRINFLFVLIILLTACSPEVVASDTPLTSPIPTETPTTFVMPTEIPTQIPTEMPTQTPTEVPPATAEDLIKNTVTIETPRGPVTMPEVDDINDALKIAAAYNTVWNDFYAGNNARVTQEDRVLVLKSLGKVVDSSLPNENFHLEVTGSEGELIQIPANKPVNGNENEYTVIVAWGYQPGSSFVFYLTHDPDPVTNLTWHPVLVHQDAKEINYLLETGQYEFIKPK